jgi:UDP-glucose 4-epimerase
VQNRIGCPLKAEKDLGFKYEIELREGLQRLIDWRKEHGVDSE